MRRLPTPSRGSTAPRHRHLDTDWLSARAALLLVALGLFVAVVGDLATLLTPFARDFAAYYAAADRLTHGAALFIPSVAAGPPDSESALAWRYAPYLAPLFVPFTALPFSVAAAAWAAMHLAVGAWIVSNLPVRRSLKVALLIWTPFVTDVWVGNISTFMLAAFVAGDRWLPARGLVGAFKPYAAITLADLAASRAWRAVLVSLALWTTAVAVSLPVVGLKAYGDFLQGIVPTLGASYTYPRGGGLLEVARDFGLPIQVATPVALAIAAMLTWVALRQGAGLRASLLVLVSAAWSPIVHIQDWLLAIPMMTATGPGVFWLMFAVYGTDHQPLWWLTTVAVTVWVQLGGMRHKAVASTTPPDPFGVADVSVEVAGP